MSSSRKADWLIPTGLIALSLVPALAGTIRVAELAGGAAPTAETARFFAARGGMTLHIVTAVAFSLLGALQFSPGLRRRRIRWHRLAGWFLVPCGLLTALSGLWLAHRRGIGSMTGTAPGDYDGTALYFVRLVVGLAMAVSLVLATQTILQRDVTRHRAWMMRAYALGLGAGTQVFTHVPWFLTPAVHSETWRTIFMASGWVLNAAIAEWLIARPSSSKHAQLAAAAGPKITADIH